MKHGDHPCGCSASPGKSAAPSFLAVEPTSPEELASAAIEGPCAAKCGCVTNIGVSAEIAPHISAEEPQLDFSVHVKMTFPAAGLPATFDWLEYNGGTSGTATISGYPHWNSWTWNDAKGNKKVGAALVETWDVFQRAAVAGTWKATDNMHFKKPTVLALWFAAKSGCVGQAGCLDCCLLGVFKVKEAVGNGMPPGILTMTGQVKLLCGPPGSCAPPRPGLETIDLSAALGNMSSPLDPNVSLPQHPEDLYNSAQMQGRTVTFSNDADHWDGSLKWAL